MGIFGDGGSVSGYNCEQVNSLRDVINNVAMKSGERIVERLHSEIIVPMSTSWYAPEAVNFFNEFAQAVATSGERITEAFDMFRAAVESAGRNWAENTEGEAPSLAAIDLVELKLNVSEIQPKTPNGDVMINEGDANRVAGKLSDVELTIKSDLQNLAKDLEAETAFLGHGQAEAVQNCFVTVSGEIHKIFKFLTDGNNSLREQIQQAVKKYQDISSGISSEFNKVGK